MDMKPSINLSIGYLNIEGIHDKVHGCKLDVLNMYLKCDIEILSETWGQCNHFSELKNYNFIRNEAQKDASIKL